MENDILDMLEDIGYNGELQDDKALEKAIETGPKSVQYTGLIEWICRELKVLCKLEETVNAVTSEDDATNFLMELSSFLKELGCCYTLLLEGHLTERLNNREKRLLLLDYLLSELMAARMIRADKPHLSKGIELKLEESSTAADLKCMLIALQFNKPPDNITSPILFSKVEQKLQEVLKAANPELLGNPLFTGNLSDKQWQTLQDVQSELQNEYRLRRELLIKRLDVTIQSFQWSDRAKKNENEIAEKFSRLRGKMTVEPEVTLADLLAARDDLAIVEKTSNASVRKNTQSSLNKVIIGRVPDRGGRPSEQEAPPPEMPSWQKERAPTSGGGGGRGGGGRGSGRVQGSWNQGHRGHDRGDHRGHDDHRDNRGGHYDNRGGYQDNRGGYRDRGGRHSGGGGGRREYR
ncbi:hypothetical protein RUM43_009871 [Polyplax serrata]|uniref:Protein FAM98A n=1 Tax=Polyplax serrata TaxID=468196 RepID=A0AAN8NZK0_POLSC